MSNNFTVKKFKDRKDKDIDNETTVNTKEID